MSRFTGVTLQTAEGTTKELLEGVNKKIGVVPNIFSGFAASPAVLQAYLQFSEALGTGKLSPQFREQIALAVAGANLCDYCASAHTAVGKSLGLDEGELEKNLGANSADLKTQAGLQFAQQIVRERGVVSNIDVQAVRDAGFSDEEIIEIIGNVSLNLFTNYFNHVNDTEVDFPLVRTEFAVGAAA